MELRPPGDPAAGQRPGAARLVRRHAELHEHPLGTGNAMKLLGKKALVTGAARGIGRGCALELARAGADVAINDRGRTEQAETVAAEIRALGRQAILVEGDVFNRPSCERVGTASVQA